MTPPTSLLAAAAVLVLAVTLPPGTQGQGTANASVYRWVEACQKVTKRHLILAEGVITSAVRQVADVNATVEAYVQRWAARVEAGADGVPGVASRIRQCRDAFTKSLDAAAAAMEAKLRQSLERQILWYDEKIFGLFTDVISEATMDGVVESVKFHLDPTLKSFDSEAVSAITDSIRNMKPAYLKVASCIRGQSMLTDQFH